PNLLVIEDNVPFKELNPWRLPDRFELTDALATARQLGGTVARTYVITVKRTNDTPEIPRHVLGPGRFNEEAFRALDLALQVANEQGVRLIIPLVDNWTWQGGRAEYAAFRGKASDAFWTDKELIDDFKTTVRFILTRTNTFTGIRYSEDPAVLCWETGNEIDSPAPWTREIAAYIRNLDANHLIMDGFNASELRTASLEMPEIDIVTTHHYPGGSKTFAQLIRENAVKAKGRKPYVVGEFGFVPTAQMEEALDAIAETRISGGLLWSLRFRNRDGGFYWHSEPAGGNLYKAFHWPPSAIAAAYDEEPLMNLAREHAFKIRGIAVPPLPVPPAPVLLPAAGSPQITWQGSVGARSYRLQRAANRSGPWSVVAENIDEAAVQYRPQWVDESAPRGEWLYRVIAVNESGASAPSNVEGPVRVEHGIFVDELSNLDRLFRHGGVTIHNRDCRQAKEDGHRAGGTKGASMIYKLPDALEGFRIFAFFPKQITPPNFSVSVDGETFREIQVLQQSYFRGGGDYGYWLPVLFHANNAGVEARFLKIQFTGETQVGRVEILHAAREPRP
ncbi:MAG TPA: cellulase family glycosylhydrolase, partial [Verrucomicrobiae bacterium]|nr:cellulase family glycosylhydrolase [Verrucomicrobiae bacterium]